MTSSRALLSALALLAALAAVGTAFATPADQQPAVARSGGTLAEPVEPVVELRGGGSVAPSTAESAQTADAGEAADGPRAQAGQAEQPTTPGGEEQDAEVAPAEESSQALVEDPATEELAGPVADAGGGGLLRPASSSARWRSSDLACCSLERPSGRAATCPHIAAAISSAAPPGL
jgi:hypothetical protein